MSQISFKSLLCLSACSVLEIGKIGTTHLFKLIVRLYKSLTSVHGQFDSALVSRGAVSGLINGFKSLESALVEAEDTKTCWCGARKSAAEQTCACFSSPLEATRAETTVMELFSFYVQSHKKHNSTGIPDRKCMQRTFFTRSGDVESGNLCLHYPECYLTGVEECI